MEWQIAALIAGFIVVYFGFAIGLLLLSVYIAQNIRRWWHFRRFGR